MNCETCNTTIDYHFLTNCPNCEPTQQAVNPIPDIHATEPVKRKHTWPRRIVNTLYTLTVSMASMFFGAMIVIFSAMIAFNTILKDTDNTTHDCGRGQMIGILCLLIGGFLGTVAGSAFAVKRPVWKS